MGSLPILFSPLSSFPLVFCSTPKELMCIAYSFHGIAYSYLAWLFWKQDVEVLILSKLFQFFGLIIIQTIWVKAIKFYIYIPSEKSNMGIFFSLFNWTGQKVKSIYLFIFKGCFHLHCFMDGLANATGAASHTHKKWSRELTSLFTENAAFKKNFFLAILHNL